MNKSSLILIGCFLLSCNHPERKNFERNQGNADGEISSDFIDSSEYSNSIPMEVENGVRYVWIHVNGILLRFIFDTGASNICISPAEASVLYRQGTLKKEDILDVEYFQDATGNISAGTTINLREIKIGSVVLENVKATIVDNVNAPLLLGQSVLERFGKIQIDNDNNLILFN
jgi:aspartyl protease family protein